ncbi:MAG TPA: hypothetical protein IAC04_02020 [Candidatus Coprenecus stercoravium]|uniref:histidine kinase n=1 Tax=Candidatus Coprenecus stercoravium TaxID=2840735 RepID=A0A9D2K8A9_9BACT|nr:hypothetical protein [Candidatus Coprenecus stercoravium]
MLKSFLNRRNTISRLEEFVYMAEKGNPLDVVFPPFPDNRLGRLLNRLVSVYRRSMTDRDMLSAAREMVVKESQDNIRQKKQLTQNISHELKTPVSSINGYLETIINNPGLSASQKDVFIRKCYEQSQRLSNLLTDLSVITRMDEASDKIDKEEVSLSDIVAGVVSDMEPIAGKCNPADGESPELKTGPADRTPMSIVNKFPSGRMIKGNPNLLYSIFRNLLENAVFYSKGTVVTISLDGEDEGYYSVSVEDDGVGVDSVHLTRIFERFYRVDKGRSRKIGGTGLGLSIVKNAVAMHGGTIKAMPVEPSGLRFEFTLAKES